LGVSVIAIFNGIYVYPYVRKAYKQYYSLKGADPTHYVRLINNF